ncbi:MAG: UDP-2,3-diacylglucosamine diphosphatase [Gammaproteobacteria bacterium]|nr:UDP-2,3-diacylglucosamine diphosphatase [Gammaproteobacteria bacterium]
MEPLRFRSIWISDVHLGTRACKAEYLLDFLQHTDSTRLYLVGDIVDFWNLKGGWYWPRLHNQVIQTAMEKASRGTEVTYVPGNHDELFRDHIGRAFGGIRVVKDVIHETADGRKLLVIHGDEFDAIVVNSKWLALLGSWMYDVLLSANRWVNWVRRRCGFPYWSLAAFLKHKVKNAVNFISHFEQALVHEAKRRQVDGVICGHIHKATLEDYGDILYGNCGDWVESCTALVERLDGSLAIVHWADESVYLLEETDHEYSHSYRRLVPAD